MVALGGHALGDDAHAVAGESLLRACQNLAPLAKSGLVITHGNGPQLGLLLRRMQDTEPPGLDVMNALTEGWLGYPIEQALENALNRSRPGEMTGSVVSLLTRVEVAADDPAFVQPEKPIGPRLTRAEAERLAAYPGYTLEPDADGYRCLVASPNPQFCLQAGAISRLLKHGYSVICAGGGGIPVTSNNAGQFEGAEAVIDKDRVSALLAEQLDARLLVLATDVKGVHPDWPARKQNVNSRPLQHIAASALASMDLDAGSMGPKAQAAADFAERTGNAAVIGSIDELAQLVCLKAGTRVTRNGPSTQDEAT